MEYIIKYKFLLIPLLVWLGIQIFKVIYLYFERGYPCIVKELLNNFKDHYDLSRNYYNEVDEGIKQVGEKRFKMLHSIYNRKVKMIEDKI